MIVIYSDYGIFTGLTETDSCCDLRIFDTLYELQRRVFINDEAIHAAPIPYLSLEECLVGLTQAKDLCVLEICI